MVRKRDIIFKKVEEKIIWNVNIKMFDYNLYFLELIKKELFDVIKIILLDWIKKKIIYINYLFYFCFVFLW